MEQYKGVFVVLAYIISGLEVAAGAFMIMAADDAELRWKGLGSMIAGAIIMTALVLSQ